MEALRRASESNEGGVTAAKRPVSLRWTKVKTRNEGSHGSGWVKWSRETFV